MEKEYKVYASQAKCAYSGYSLVAAECATRANEIIQEFQDEDTDNNFDSWGYEKVSEDDVIESLHSYEEGIIHHGIMYSGTC